MSTDPLVEANRYMLTLSHADQVRLAGYFADELKARLPAEGARCTVHLEQVANDAFVAARATLEGGGA
jgi:hypothetical protein